MDGWNTSFLLGRPIFRGYVSFREGNMAFETLGLVQMSFPYGALPPGRCYAPTLGGREDEEIIHKKYNRKDDPLEKYSCYL